MDKLKLRRKDFIDVIDNVFENESNLNNHLDKKEFIKTYFTIIKRLKENSIYKFTREQYQTSIRLYFYYSQEKSIYFILALALIERGLFDDWCY